jgi:hypothetical protein
VACHDLFGAVGGVVGHAGLHELLVVGLEHSHELIGRGVVLLLKSLINTR